MNAKIQNPKSIYPDLGVGLGLRSTHYDFILKNKPRTPWFEAISENFMGIESGAGGNPIKILEQVRENYPIVLHGVSMSIGSADPINLSYLRSLKILINRIQPAWVSDHLCWTGVDGENLHDLLPLPYTEEALKLLVSKIKQTQDVLGRQILFENPSTYLSFVHSEMSEWDFISEMAEQADCGILLDVNNIYVSAMNHNFNPETYLNSIPKNRVGQIHLAGHSNQKTYLFDTHDHPVADPVWDLYRKAVRRFGGVSTLIEWDAEIPEYPILDAEAHKAEIIRESILNLPKDQYEPSLAY